MTTDELCLDTRDEFSPESGQHARIKRHVQVAIIGAGFSGLGMAIRLLGAGEDDFLVFERAAELGGTWRDNIYPGAECDIQTDLYSYSFAPNPTWSKTYAAHDELLRYLKNCAEQFKVSPFLRFNHELLSATWDASKQHWRLRTTAGHYTAAILVSGMGYLCEPKFPDLDGLASFTGISMHSRNWNRGIDLSHKRVAVVGSGASAIQIVPAIQPIASKVTVFQRTPPWIMGKHGKANTGLEGWALRNLPGYQRLKRDYHRLTAEMVVWQLGQPHRTVMMRRIAQKHLEQSVSDPDLRQKLQPDYAIGCRRILFSDTYYQALQEPNVDLICNPIRHIEPSGVVTEDGTSFEADILVLATGFQSAELPFAKSIHGIAGTTLAEAWQEGQHAYLGSTVSGFPNFFMLLGPNTTIGHTSMTLMMEAQLNYVTDAIKVIRQQGISAVNVKQNVVSSYNHDLQDSLAPTVWNAGGCQSYYLDRNGRNTTIWPHTTLHFHNLTRRFDLENYDRF